MASDENLIEKYSGLGEQDVKVETKPCPRCGEIKFLEVKASQVVAYLRGELIQKAFPNLHKDDRERFISGYCQRCWDKLFKD